MMNLIGIKSIAVVGAHPDDIELGCLGTLLKLDPSVEIHAFIGSTGSAGDPSSGMDRIEESRAARCDSSEGVRKYTPVSLMPSAMRKPTVTVTKPAPKRNLALADMSTI